MSRFQLVNFVIIMANGQVQNKGRPTVSAWCLSPCFLANPDGFGQRGALPHGAATNAACFKVLTGQGQLSGLLI